MSHFYQEWEEPFHARKEDNLSFPLHLHASVELAYLASGSTTLKVLSSRYPMQAGDLAVIFPGQLHGYDSMHQDSRLLLMIFHASLVTDYVHELEYFHPEMPVLSAGNLPPELLTAFHSVYQLPYQTDLRIHRAWLHLIMAYLFSSIQLVENTDAGGTLLISRILEYLHGHFMEPVTLDTLARELHVNKFYLSHTFSNTLLMGFNAYLNKLRAERAMMLLRTTDQSIETIGALVGFGTQRTFDRVFKKMTSLTPREYRQKYLTSEGIDNTGMPGKLLAYTEERYS